MRRSQSFKVKQTLLSPKVEFVLQPAKNKTAVLTQDRQHADVQHTVVLMILRCRSHQVVNETKDNRDKASGLIFNLKIILFFLQNMNSSALK